jgi:hypothetical protein
VRRVLAATAVAATALLALTACGDSGECPKASAPVTITTAGYTSHVTPHYTRPAPVRPAPVRPAPKPNLTKPKPVKPAPVRPYHPSTGGGTTHHHYHHQDSNPASSPWFWLWLSDNDDHSEQCR